jgi:hypothetical protein
MFDEVAQQISSYFECWPGMALLIAWPFRTYLEEGFRSLVQDDAESMFPQKGLEMLMVVVIGFDLICIGLLVILAFRPDGLTFEGLAGVIVILALEFQYTKSMFQLKYV